MMYSSFNSDGMSYKKNRSSRILKIHLHKIDCYRISYSVLILGENLIYYSNYMFVYRGKFLNNTATASLINRCLGV